MGGGAIQQPETMTRTRYTKDGQQVKLEGGDIDGIFCWGYVGNNTGILHYWLQSNGYCMSHEPHLSTKESDRLSTLDLVKQ